MDSMLLSILCVFGLIGGSLAQPAVTALICYPPPTVANAVYAPVQQVYQVGTTIRFTCRAGFRFTPTSSETAQCRSLAGRPTTWRLEPQKTAPVCVLIAPTRPVNPVVPVNPVAPVPRCQGRCPQLSECQRYNNVDICVCNDGYYNSNGVCTARTSDTLTTCRSPPCPPNSDPHLINGKYVHICKPTHFVFGNICAPRSTGRAQCSRPAVGPNVIIAADPGKTTWYSGETINYACSGQMIVTPSSRRQAVCGPTGLFSTPPPTCRMPEVAPRTTTQAPTAAPIRCGRPPVPVNGALISVAANQITFAPGTRVFITCNQGYQLTGDNSVVCLPTGRWSATITLCSLPTQQPDTGSDTPCYSPIAPVNGGVSPEGDFTWNTGDRVTYTCNPGFVLTEPAVQTCLANGRFSNNPPECVRPSGACPPPPVPFGGSVDKPNLLSYPVGIVITYTCNDGYSMFGSSTITCQSNRQYQPPAPQCTSISRVNPVQPVVVPSQRPVVTIVTCPPPPGLQNGYISAGQKSVYSQGDVVTFSCNQPYRIQGNPSVVCQQNGQFNQLTAFCLAVPVQPVIVQTAAPPPLRTTTLPPPIAPVVCRNPSVPPFGVPSTATFPVGSVFTYQCQPGYAVAGDTFTLCQRDGTFQTTVTRCVLVSPVTVAPAGCRRPAAPSNGFILGESTFWAVGQMILYGCNSGFSLVGAETLPCQSDGSFGNAPQCINVAVPTASCTPNPPPNGQVREDGKTSYLPGDTITYECRNGFVESGLATGICLPNGQWRTAPFSCRAAQGALINACVAATSTPENAILTPIQLTYNYFEFVTVQCLPGYTLVGNAQGQCTEDGIAYAGIPPRCVPISAQGILDGILSG